MEDSGLLQGAEVSAVDKATIVLHPGSTHLHFGLSTDPTPHSIPHLIAYREKRETKSLDNRTPGNSGATPPHIAQKNCEHSQQNSYRDESLILKHPNEVVSELEAQRAEGMVSIRQSISSARASLGVTNYPIDKDKYLNYNSRMQPVARDSDELSLTNLAGQPHCIIGSEVLYLPPNSGYIVYKPFKYGRLNVKQESEGSMPMGDSGGGYSLSFVLNMLEDLWTKAIEEYLEVEKKDFKVCAHFPGGAVGYCRIIPDESYHVIVLVPDLIDRTFLKELVNVLLLRMEFSSAFLHQESVCATFSAGLSSACVVNVGGEVTHVCCVEEGMSNPNTRVTLRYGGSDITRLFFWLLKQTNLPYSECAAESRLDAVLVQELKESVCHLDPSVRGVKEHPFSVMSPTPGVLLDYEMKLSDETLQAPMGVFFPSVFCLPDDHTPLMWGQQPLQPDCEDLFDEGHWIGEGGAAPQGKGVSSKTESQGVSSSASGAMGSTNTVELPEATKRLKNVPAGKLLGLDQAVHFSIDCASSSEMKYKLYGSILIIGGGLAFQGAAAMLQARLELQLPTLINRSTQTVEVFSNPRELESSIVVWKGGAVLSCLDTCHELRIERQEWEFSGVRLLRERAPFTWSWISDWLSIHSSLLKSSFVVRREESMNAEKHEGSMSLLQKWGKKLTSRLFEVNSLLTGDQKKAIVAILHRIGNPDQDNILKWSPVPGKLKIVLCFPYALGFACEEGKISSSLINLHKPILIVAASNHCFSHLEKHLSTDITNGSKPYLLTRGILSTNDISEGAYYDTLTIKSDIDANNISSMRHCDIVLTKFQCCMDLPDNYFSIVLVYGNRDLSAEQQHCLKFKFAEHTQIVLFTTPPMVEQQEECRSEETTVVDHSRYKQHSNISKLVRHADGIISTDRIRSLLSKRQLSVLWKVVDKFDNKHENTPLIVSMRAGMGEIEMLCFLPYFLGKASTAHTDIDLSKPILIIVPNLDRMTLLKKHLRDKPYLIESGYLQHEEIADKALYNTHVVEDHFDAVTLTKVNNTHELVLSAQDYYQSLPSDNFSVVVIYESNLLSRQLEKDITLSFEQAKIILFRVASNETAKKFAAEVRSRLEYMQQGQEFFVPTLVRYGKQIKERIFSDSLLSEQQLLGLRAMVDWFVYSDSKHQPARIDSTIEYEQAGAMICCLPYMFGWAVSCKLIDSKEMNLKKPLLIICRSTDTLNQLWDLLHVNPFIKNFVTSKDTLSNVLFHSYLFSGSESASDLSSALDNNEVVVSPMKYLDRLPENLFSVVISYAFGTTEEDLQKSIIRKFDRYSQLIFINVHSDSCPSETSEHEVIACSPLLKFGGIIKKERLFGDISRLNTREMNVLQDVVKWFSDSDTKDLPLVVDNTPHSNSDIIVSCLPYMLGWAVDEHIISMKEIDLSHKCILVLALDTIALNTLINILFYPFLVRHAIIDPSQVHAGAYYRTKIITGEDNTNFKTIKNQFDILVADVKYINCIPVESFAFILGYSCSIDLSNQEEIQKVAALAKVKVMVIQGSGKPHDAYDQCSSEYTSAIGGDIRSRKNITTSIQNAIQDGILENHSKFTISKLKKYNEDAATSFSELDHKDYKPKKKKNNTNSKSIRASLEGPYYKCMCGRELGPSVDRASPYCLPGTVPVLGMAMCPNCTISPLSLQPTRGAQRENDFPLNLPMTEECHQKKTISQDLLPTKNDQESNNRPRNIMPTTTQEENGFPQNVLPSKFHQEYSSQYASNDSLPSQTTGRIAVRAAGKETQTSKISKSYYLKRVKASQNSKGNQAKIESVQHAPKLYRCYGSKYYKQLESASGFRKLIVCESETAVKPTQILIRHFQDPALVLNEGPKTTLGHSTISGEPQVELYNDDGISGLKKENSASEERNEQCKTILVSDSRATKDNQECDEMLMQNALASLENKMSGIDKTEQEQQVESTSTSSSHNKSMKVMQGKRQGIEIEGKVANTKHDGSLEVNTLDEASNTSEKSTCDEESLLHAKKRQLPEYDAYRYQEMTKVNNKLKISEESQVQLYDGDISRRKTLPILHGISKKEKPGAEEKGLKHCKTIQMSDLIAMKDNQDSDEILMLNAHFSMEDKMSGEITEPGQIDLGDQSKNSTSENSEGDQSKNSTSENSEEVIPVDGTSSLKVNVLNMSRYSTTCDELHMLSVEEIKQTSKDDVEKLEGKISEKESSDWSEHHQTSYTLTKLRSNSTREATEEIDTNSQSQQAYPETSCDAKPRANSVKLLTHSAFLILYNQLRKTRDKESFTEFDKNSSFHLIKFLNENKDKIKASPESTLDALISFAAKDQEQQHSKFKSRHSSDIGYNGHLLCPQMKFEEQRLIDAEDCDSQKESQEAKVSTKLYESQSEMKFEEQKLNNVESSDSQKESQEAKEVSTELYQNISASQSEMEFEEQKLNNVEINDSQKESQEVSTELYQNISASQSEMEFEEQKLNDVENSDSQKQSQEAKEVSTELYQNTSESQSETKLSEVVSNLDKNHNEYLQSTEILALRTVDDNGKQENTLPQHQSLEIEIQDDQPSQNICSQNRSSTENF